MGQYKREDIPPAPLHGFEELQGQLDRFSPSAVLRRVEQERYELASALDREHGLLKKAETDRFDLRRRVLALEAELASARQELDAVRTARDNLDRQLALAHREVLELDAQIKLCPRCGVEVDAEINGTEPPAIASWIVARDGGRDCARCDQEIRRGEAYEYLPTIDELQHIHCRLPEES